VFFSIHVLSFWHARRRKDGKPAERVAAADPGGGPYRIGYDAIVPQRSQCENLFVPFALSASHTAFASIRMEPVFMVSSQSAATAACLAIDANTAVQAVDYPTLRARLIEDGQILERK